MRLSFLITFVLIFVPIVYIYLPLIIVAASHLSQAMSNSFALIINSVTTASEFEGITLTGFAEERLHSWPYISNLLKPTFEDYLYQGVALLFSLGLPLIFVLFLIQISYRFFAHNSWLSVRYFLARNKVVLISLIVLIVGFLFYQNSQFVRDKFDVGLSNKPKQAAFTSILKGRITHVRDGDTFEVLGKAVRISALDCPENSTLAGKKVTRFAKQFKGKYAICELTGATTYERVVGYCSIDGVDFGRTMMDKTSCKLWKKYDVWNRY